MGCPSPALPTACSAVPVRLGRTHSSGNSTGQQVGGAGQLHSDSTDGVWTWGLARHRTALVEKRAWLYSHYLQWGHLWPWWVLRSLGGWWQAQGGLAGSPFRCPKKTYIGRVSPYIS